MLLLLQTQAIWDGYCYESELPRESSVKVNVLDSTSAALHALSPLMKNEAKAGTLTFIFMKLLSFYIPLIYTSHDNQMRSVHIFKDTVQGNFTYIIGSLKYGLCPEKQLSTVQTDYDHSMEWYLS